MKPAIFMLILAAIGFFIGFLIAGIVGAGWCMSIGASVAAILYRLIPWQG